MVTLMLRKMISALPQRNLKSQFLSLQAVLKNSQTFKRLARPNARRRRAARRRQPDFGVDMAGLGVVSMVSDMSQSPQGVRKKRNRPNARQRRHCRAARSPVEDMAFGAPHRVVICVASLQKRLGLTTKDADISAVWLTRDEFGMTFLDQLGLRILVIYWSCRRASRRSVHIFLRICGSNFGHQSPPFLFSTNKDLVSKLSACSGFAYTYIHCYLFLTRI